MKSLKEQPETLKNEKKTTDNSKTDLQSTEISIHDLELGEYFLHIYILETANLATDGDINAIINIEGFGAQKYSKVMKGLGQSSKTFWGEHIFFQKKFDTREELENSSFNITVFNHSSFLKNDKIGMTSSLLLSVYGQHEHCLIEKWAILTNPEKDFRSAMGFIKFSACFDRVTQSHPNLEALSLGHSNASFDLLAIPPEIKLQSKQLIIKVFKGKNIVPMDLDGSADPFVKFNIGGTKIKSNIKKSTLEPQFYQILYIPLLYPSVLEKMIMKFKDYDLIGKNENIGSTYYLLSEILKGSYSMPHWAYFYGGHDKVIDDDFVKTMNKNSELGSRLKGSLLASMEIKETDDIKFTSEEMTKDEVAEENLVNRLEFTARVDVDYIENIKCDASELKLSIKWGSDRGVTSQPVSYKRGVLVFSRTFTLKETFEVSSKMNTYEQLPDLIISVVNDKLHISYIRLKAREFICSKDCPFYELTTRLNADLAVADTPEDKAGIIKFKIGVETTQNFLGHLPKWPEPVSKPFFEKIYLAINLIRAKDLLPADPTSTSDPIVQFYHLGSTTKSSLFPETLNPSWNEKIVMQSYLINDDLAPLIVNVSDRDENFVGTVSYDFLGSTFVSLSKNNIAKTKSQISNIKPSWYELSVGKNLNLGKILLGVTVVREELFSYLTAEKLIDQTSTFTKPLNCVKTKHHIKINILGLRNLQSNGIFPVKSVNVKINTSSLKAVNQIQRGSAFSNLTAISKSGGANPSIGTVLSITVDLPDELIFIPTLSCQVLENSLSFLKSESLIGTFQIELAAHSYISKITMIEKLKVVQRYREQLKKSEKDNFAVHENILNKVNGIIKHLEAGVGLNFSYIKEEEKEIYRKGEEIKENIAMLTASTLINYFDKDQDVKKDITSEEIKDFKDTQNPQRAIVVKDEGFFSTFLPEINPNEEEKLKLLSTVRLPIDRESQRLLAIKFSDIIPQDKIVIVPDTQNPLWISPNPKFYLLLGYKTKKIDNRHYRFFMNTPLETSYYMGEDLYTSIDIFRGKKPTFEKKDILSRLFSRFEENYRKTGVFKGNVEIIQDEVLNQIINLRLTEKELNTLEIPRSIEEWKYSKIDADMLRGTKVVVTLYVISAEFYTTEDLNSENDSYIQVSFAGKTIKDTKIIQNKNNPKFYRKFVFEGNFPGPSDLILTFYDQDDINPDDIIGSTSIDVERRFFDKRLRSFGNKPIETRQIYHSNSEASIGQVMLWVDIEPIARGGNAGWNIDPRPVTTLELRIVIWEIQNMPLLDFEDVSDLYVSVNLPNFDLLQKTDTHLRAQNGYGSFNWRTVFKLKIDENSRPEHYRVNFRVFDKDLLSPDDFAADATMDFSALVQSVLENETRYALTGISVKGVDGSKDFIVPLNLTKQPAKASEGKKKPYVLVSIDLLSEQIAANSPVGIGRSDPNQDPYLPPPKGRFMFSVNPFSWIEQMMGPAFKGKICIIIFILVLCLIFLIFLPIFISTLISVIIAKNI
jgi:hypothetical protein